MTAACPGCAAAPDAPPPPSPVALLLHLPEIHCAGCIQGVERALARQPGVASARVNLSLKRVAIEAADWVEPRALIEALRAAGHTALEVDQDRLSRADPVERALLLRLGVAGFAMMNVMLLSVAVWSGADAATRDLFHLISALIAVPAAAFAAQPFFASARAALGGWRLNMDVPISLAILLALGLSVHEAVAGGAHAYFDAALSLTFFLLIGRYLDRRIRGAARSAAQALAALEVPRALRREGGRWAEVKAADLRPGDTILVPAGSRLPADGSVQEGRSELDRALLTGETRPAAIGPGDALAAGEVNLTGPLQVRVTAAGRDTRLSRIADLVASAEAARSAYVTLADKAARIYAPVVHLLALAALVGWWAATGDFRHALNVAVATLIITCPCALGLAVPAVSAAASGKLFRRGVLLTSPTALERLAEADCAVFDKTGTLTEGALRLAGRADPAHLALAAGLAEGSSHPLARALAQAAEADGVAPTPVTGRTERPGDGIAGTAAGRPVRLGRAAWVGATPVAATATYLDTGSETVAFAFEDTPRDGAAEAVAGLAALGLPARLLSGDTPAAAAALAARLGIAEAEGGVAPEAKAARLTALKAAGAKPLMVGDGLNDTAALAEAHVSAAPASALDAARAVADVALTSQSLAPLPGIVATARAARARMRENLLIAACYNAVSIPLALAGFATPLMAALAMSTSSICVSLNAMRLK